MLYMCNVFSSNSSKKKKKKHTQKKKNKKRNNIIYIWHCLLVVDFSLLSYLLLCLVHKDMHIKSKHSAKQWNKHLRIRCLALQAKNDYVIKKLKIKWKNKANHVSNKRVFSVSFFLFVSFYFRCIQIIENFKYSKAR